ncbi:MAG: helix-turn-helix domain-containing protein [Bacteroidota bacterium]
MSRAEKQAIIRVRRAPYPSNRQAEYLAFISDYTKLHGRPHAQADIEQHFRIPPPSVHQMVLTLHKKGFLRRVAGQARSLEVLVDRPSLPYR